MKSFLLYTTDPIQAKIEINNNHGRALLVMTDHLLTAEFPDQFNINELKFSTAEIPSALDPISALSLSAWRSFEQKRAKEFAPDATDGLPWTTSGFEAPKFFKPSQMNVAGLVDTSRYMIGSIAVAIVIVSGPGNLAISADEATVVISEVQEALAFLVNAEPRAKITFEHKIHLVQVDAQPLPSPTIGNAEAVWRNPALVKLGLPGTDGGSRMLVRNLRTEKNSRWAYVAYFTKYPLGHFAYTIDERVVMSYYNSDWGTRNINKVFAHETCHIFGAADEYDNCRCTTTHGHLGILNGNCHGCAPNPVVCLMHNNELTMCNWTRHQIGWHEELFQTQNT